MAASNYWPLLSSADRLSLYNDDDDVNGRTVAIIVELLLVRPMSSYNLLILKLVIVNDR